jgi:hypothetical protein
MNFQKDKAMRELDTNIYKIVDSYRLLLRKGQVNATGTVGAHEGLQVEAASASIVRNLYWALPLVSHRLTDSVVLQVFHAQAILDQIHELRMQLLLQEAGAEDSAELDS